MWHKASFASCHIVFGNQSTTYDLRLERALLFLAATPPPILPVLGGWAVSGCNSAKGDTQSIPCSGACHGRVLSESLAVTLDSNLKGKQPKVGTRRAHSRHRRDTP